MQVVFRTIVHENLQKQKIEGYFEYGGDRLDYSWIFEKTKL